MVSYAELSLNNAIEKGVSIDMITSQIDVINKSKLGDYGFLSYDANSKSVNFNLLLQGADAICEKK